MKNTLATISFIFGILSLSPILIFIPGFQIIFLLLFWAIPLLSLAGIITGIIAIVQIRKNQQEGMKFAIMGIIFSILGPVLAFIILLGAFSVIGNFI